MFETFVNMNSYKSGFFALLSLLSSIFISLILLCVDLVARALRFPVRTAHRLLVIQQWNGIIRSITRVIVVIGLPHEIS